MKCILIPLTALTVASRMAFGADIIYVAEEQLQRVSIAELDGSLRPLPFNVGLVYGLAVDAAGNLYAAAAGNDVIRKITPAGVVSVVASGTVLSSPSGLAVDEAGNLYSTGLGWPGPILRISPDGTITVLATGVGGNALARDAAGNLYASQNDRVLKLATNGVTTTVASGFQFAWGLAFDQHGNLFVADYLANTVSKVTPSGAVSLFASGLDRPTGVAFDSQGNLYVCNISARQPLGHLVQVTPDGRVSAFPPALDYPTAIAIYKEPVIAPTNHPPVARCTNVVVFAGGSGVAAASVDNGSYDPDGDPITITQTPPGPYPLGTSQVTLTVTDNHGASDSCHATVTVVDTMPPEIWSAAANPSVLWPPNHKMVAVSLNARVADNSGAATWKIIHVQDSEAVSRSGKGTPSPDWVITGDHTLQLRSERRNGQADRVYSITIQATDASGNLSAPQDVTVTVPANQGRNK
jgi:sugar lactone lactonase YvrE